MALAAAVGAVLATAALSIDPDVVELSESWLQQFDFASGLATSVERGQRIAGGPVILMYLWQTAVIVGLVTFGVAGFAFLVSATRFVERAVRQRMRGWNTDTLLDVAADHDGRSGMILMGSGDFAPVRESTRHKILLARRGLSATVVAGTAWITVAFGIRLLVLALGLAKAETAATLLSAADVVLLLAPGGACLLFALFFIGWERLLLGRLGRPHSFEADPEDVSRWYESHPGEATEPATPLTKKRERTTVWSARTVLVVLVLLGPLALIGLVLASLATFTATRFPDWHAASTASIVAGLEAIDRRDPIGTARSAWSRYLPLPDSTPTEVATELLRVLNHGTDHPDALPDYPAVTSAFFQWDELERRTITDRAFERALRREIPPDTLDLVNRLANHARTGLLRRLAATPRIDVLSAIALGDDSGAPATLTGQRRLDPIVLEAARANVLGAVLHAAQGDVEAAYRRLGENAAIGEHLLAVPSYAINHQGLTLLSGHALLPLASLERARGEIDNAVQLARAAEEVRAVRDLGGAVGLAVFPGNLGQFANAVTDRRVPTGYRIRWLTQGWAGSCAFPREILLGPSPQRVVAMHAIADSMENRPAVAEALRSSEADWRRPFSSSRTSAEQSPSHVRVLDRLFLGSLLRVLSCADPSTAQ